MSKLLNKYLFDYLLGLIHELDPFGNAEMSAEYWQHIDDGFHYLYDQHYDYDGIYYYEHC